MASLFYQMLRSLGFTSEDERDLAPNFDKPIPCSDMGNMNLGVRVADGKVLVLIPENSKFPIQHTTIVRTSVDNQHSTAVRVYEGESSLARDNVLLGEVMLFGIPPAPKGVSNIKVCFDIDVNGTLKVSAVHTVFSDLENEITITSAQRRSAKMLDAKNKLKRYANGIKQTLGDAIYKAKLKEVDKKEIMNVANEAIKWLNKNPSAALYEYKGWQKELQVLWNPIITKVHQDAAGVEPLSSSSPAKAGSKLDEVD